MHRHLPAGWAGCECTPPLFQITWSHTWKIPNSCTAEQKTREKSGNDEKFMRRPPEHCPLWTHSMGCKCQHCKHQPNASRGRKPAGSGDKLQRADSSQPRAGNHQSRETARQPSQHAAQTALHSSPVCPLEKEENKTCGDTSANVGILC